MTGKPIDSHFFAMRPTPFTRFFRVFVPWQLVRFLVVNLRMTMMILKSHDTHLPAAADLNPAAESAARDAQAASRR